MKPTRLVVLWETRLRKEGLGALDGKYTHKSRVVHYAIPDRVRYGVHSQAYLFEFFSRCQEFAQTGGAKWPLIWNLFSQGMTYRAIGRRVSLHQDAVRGRIRYMRNAMKKHLDAQVVEQPEPTKQTDILEIFAEQQQRKGN